MKRGHIVRYVNDCYLFGIGVYYLSLLFIYVILMSISHVCFLFFYLTHLCVD